MKYDFDSVTDRKNSNSLKWDISDNEQPMWKCYMCGECARYDSSTLQQIINNGEDNVQDNFDRDNRVDE